MLQNNESKIIDENNLKNQEILVGEQLVPKPSKTFTISRKIRWLIFSILISVSVTTGLDQGIISGSTSEITKDYNMSDTELGGFGGMVFIGFSLGCVLSFVLINKFSRKNLLLITTFVDVLSLFFITQSNNLFLLYICRVITGFSSSFLSVYIPVWSDQFGIHKRKSIMMSIIHISSSLGYLIGYAFGIIFGWKNTFYLQTGTILVQVLVMCIVLPKRYFSSTTMPLKAKNQIKKELEMQNLLKNKNEKKDTSIDYSEIKNINNKDIIDNNNISNNNNINNNINNNNSSTTNQPNNDDLNKDNNTNKEQEDDISLFEDIEKVENKQLSKESIFKHVKILIKSPLFILMNILLISMFIIISAIQFWCNDYMENAILISDKNSRLYAFSIVVVTAPIFGILLGGILSTKIGGYDSAKAIYIPLYSSLGVVIMANIIPLTNNIYLFSSYFWIYLFFGSLILPVTNGIILCSVSKEYSGSASSVSTLLYNILGRCIGPNLYGIFKSMFHEKHPKIPMWILLNVSIIGFLSTLIALRFHKRKYQNLSEEKENELDKTNIKEDDILKDTGTESNESV